MYGSPYQYFSSIIFLFLFFSHDIFPPFFCLHSPHALVTWLFQHIIPHFWSTLHGFIPFLSFPVYKYCFGTLINLIMFSFLFQYPINLFVQAFLGTIILFSDVYKRQVCVRARARVGKSNSYRVAVGNLTKINNICNVDYNTATRLIVAIMYVREILGDYESKIQPM